MGIVGSAKQDQCRYCTNRNNRTHQVQNQNIKILKYKVLYIATPEAAGLQPDHIGVGNLN